ncbi:MAG: alpha/beta hydrolase, partial [Desulfobacterales bacterium]|nr:alpha/beta hydrolase [Desulfobacterales bacterium]
MSEWFSGEVVANGIKIHYTRTGGDKPPVVLSHGFTDNGLCWTRAAWVLEKDYDVVMYDARGHGLSDAPEAGYSAEDHAADLAGLIQALELKDPRPVLMGHSMGASTAA